MLKAYKYALLPNDIQKEQLKNFFGAARFVYNLGLETKIAAWTSARKNLTCFDLHKQLTELKQTECLWLNDAPSQMLQFSIRKLDNAYTNFFKGSGFPRFKNKWAKQSISFPRGVYIDGGSVFIPKLKQVDFIQHRPIGDGEIKTVTVSATTTGKYFISLLINTGEELPLKKKIKTNTSAGIDVGLKTLATLSDGTEFENPRYLQHQLKRLRIEQRKLSRKFKKGAHEQSVGYYKQKLIVAKLHEKVANQRKDFLHKVSDSITKNYDTICLEDLNVSGMKKNEKLARSISDVSWYEFTRQLEYKSEWRGKNIIYIGRFDPSSKICSNCGNIFKELTLDHREWDCPKCGSHHNRDHNAAKNIKNFGLKAKPSTVNVSR